MNLNDMVNSKSTKASILSCTLFFLVACQSFQQQTPQEIRANQERSVVMHYVDLAHTQYSDSLRLAEQLRHAATMLVLSPSSQNLEFAKEAWLNARVPYQQTEVFRFGNPVVDEWEGQLNAWPLDEGLIDYVDNEYYEAALGNPGANANVVANRILRVGKRALNATAITPTFLESLNEIGGSEANVATGYHAIEFLLWGQDLNGTEVGAGNRPYTDYGKGDACSNENCDRRGAYLIAASQLLVDDLQYMVDQWAEGGEYRKEFLGLNSHEAIRRIIFGMGSLSLGELAGERMKVALEANSTEDEHDCFSDNTHYSHYYNVLGIQNIYLGRYKEYDGPYLSGSGLSYLVKQIDPALDQKIVMSLDKSMAAVQRLVASAEDPETPMTFDMMIAEGNREGRELITSVMDALREQTSLFEKMELAIKASLPES